MKNEKEIWIEKMMSLSSAADSAFNSQNEILCKILDKIDQPEMTNKIVSFNQFRLAGMAAITILALNISVFTLTRSQIASKDEIRTAYELSTYNLDLY